MNSGCKYILDVPYPSIGLLPPNPAKVRILMSDYAGPNSEFTAISQYIYNNLLAKNMGNLEISDLFSCIAMIEMKHLKLIGELISAYGGDPAYMSYMGNRGAWWNGSNVKYYKDLDLMLNHAINAEREAINAYTQHINQLGDEAAIKLLERIILDERHHIDLFSEMMQKYM